MPLTQRSSDYNGSVDTLFKWPGAVIPLPPDGERQHCRIPPFNLRRGTITALRGESGSGKSYFLSYLAATVDHTERKEPLLPHSFVYVPQFAHFHENTTVRWEVLHVWRKTASSLIHAGLDESDGITKCSRQLKERINLLAEEFFPGRSSGLLGKKISQLSGGEKKRLSLMLRLGFPADILVLDEPDSGLDLKAAEQLLNVVLNLHETVWQKVPGPPAILLVSHQENLLDTFGDRVTEVVVEKSSLIENEEPCGLAEPDVISESRPTPFFLNSSRDWSEFRHQTWLMLNGRDLFMLIFAPAVIFALLHLTEDTLVEGEPASKISKYALFSLIALTWLSAQMTAKLPVEHMRMIREEAWLYIHLLAGRRHPARGVLSIDVGLGYTYLVFLVAIIQATIALVALNIRTDYFFSNLVFIVPFLFASLYGAAIGFSVSGIAVLFATSHLPGSKKTLPTLVWPSLIVPIVLLCHIVFTAPYLRGEAFMAIQHESGLRYTLARMNPIGYFQNFFEGYWEYNQLMWKDLLFQPGMAIFVVWIAAGFIGLHRIIKLPDIRD